MNVLKTETAVLRFVPTQLVVTHAPASQVIDWEMMDIHAMVSIIIPSTTKLTTTINNCAQISMNVLRVPMDAIKPVQIRLAVTPVLVAQAIS